MKIYIHSAACISPQPVFEQTGEWCIAEYGDNQLKCIEPDYSKYIDAKHIRRASRMMKMGLTTALAALKSANINQPEAIITGTGLGCIEDSERFLSKMVDVNDRGMNPTAFIQSTHNTISTNIALILRNHGYNNTHTQAGLSFDSALNDGILIMQQEEAANVLVGAIDELTPTLFHILNRLSEIKRQTLSNLKVFKGKSKGYLAGEGSAFFVLSKESSDIQILDQEIIRRPNENQLLQMVEKWNTENTIDLVILGKNGDEKGDQKYEWIENGMNQSLFCNYKHLCGEYYTASSFGLWLAYSILKGHFVPFTFNKQIKNILLYNYSMEDNHSFIRLQKC